MRYLIATLLIFVAAGLVPSCPLEQRCSGCQGPPMRVRGRPLYNLRRNRQYWLTGDYMDYDRDLACYKARALPAVPPPPSK